MSANIRANGAKACLIGAALLLIGAIASPVLGAQLLGAAIALAGVAIMLLAPEAAGTESRLAFIAFGLATVAIGADGVIESFSLLAL